MTASATESYYLIPTTTVVSQGWATWSDNVLVDASALPATTILYITTDDRTPSATNFNYILVGGQQAIVANRHPDLYGLEYAGSGGLSNDGATTGSGGTLPNNGVGITAQSRPTGLWSSGYPTYIQILATVANTTLPVLVEPR
jgi:hypothetical protein